MTRALPFTLALLIGCASEPGAPAELSYADATEQALSQRFEEAYGVPLASLDCPDDLAASDRPSTCTASAEGVTFDLVVQNDSDDPASVLAKWKAAGVLFRERTEAELADLLPMLAGGPVDVVCEGADVRLVSVGDTFSCDVTLTETGETTTGAATVFGDDGRVSIEVYGEEAAVVPAEALIW